MVPRGKVSFKDPTAVPHFLCGTIMVGAALKIIGCMVLYAFAALRMEGSLGRRAVRST